MNCPHCGSKQGAMFLGRPKRGNIKAKILETINNAGPQGVTVDDLERLLALPHQTVSARVNELGNAREIDTNGKRQNPSGKPAWVWVGLESARAESIRFQEEHSR